MKEVWIWQRYTSPHIAGFARALAERVPTVRYIVANPLHEERVRLGWTEPDIGRAELWMCPDRETAERLAYEAPQECEHIFQSIRANGALIYAQKVMRERGTPYWATLETVNDAGFVGRVKRGLYRYLIARRQTELRGMLAIGHTMPHWLAARGMPPNKIFPFTYFLPDDDAPLPKTKSANFKDEPFRLVFVGKLIKRKGVELLLQALALVDTLADRISLQVIGSGPEEAMLRHQVSILGLGGAVEFLGSRPIVEIPTIVGAADLLVLPSHFDGWGAVATEALMAGTPVVVSDRCGAAEAVRASGVGGVFPASDAAALAVLLDHLVGEGPIESHRRAALAAWAVAFGATSGAEYFLDLCAAADAGEAAPAPPWRRSTPENTLRGRG